MAGLTVWRNLTYVLLVAAVFFAFWGRSVVASYEEARASREALIHRVETDDMMRSIGVCRWQVAVHEQARDDVWARRDPQFLKQMEEWCGKWAGPIRTRPHNRSSKQ